MNILHLTDPHLYGDANAQLRGIATDASFRAVLDDALERFPDYAALLMTGDLVQDDARGYLRFRSILAQVDKPVLCIPGNHDLPEVMQRELRGPPFEICGTHRIGTWQFVMLDSYDPGHVGGRLASAELERLEAALGTRGVHTMVCLHHHPTAMGSRWLDGVGLANCDEFWRIIDAHANVEAVVWGHVHQHYEGRRGKVRLFATPSTGAQFLPGSDGYAIDLRPPAYRHFRLHADGGIETETHWLAAVPAKKTA
jgi:Icc protein